MKELEVLKVAIKEAGKIVMRFYDNPEIHYKEDESPVTEADLAAEKFLMNALSSFGYPFLSEETEDDLGRLKSNRVWIMDPLDGTQGFIQKTGEFSIMVGLVENGRPILGAVYQPIDKKLFYAEKGKGAFLEIDGGEAQKMKVNETKNPQEARMVVSKNHLKPKDERVGEILKVTEFFKSSSNGVKINKIAQKKADFFINTTDKMGEWDFCSPEIILTEAGGKMTNINKKELIYNKKNPKMIGGLVASNGKFHDKIVEAIGEVSSIK